MRTYFSSISLPFSTESDWFSFFIHCLILLRAELLLAILSQSVEGPLELFDVMISTILPFLSVVSIGTILPFTFAPTHLYPTAECILKAKSRGVEPAGSSTTSPCGVNTYTCEAKRSILSVSINSLGSFISFCHSRVCLSHASLTSSFSLLFLFIPSLYFQCAAIPYSAILCISYVLIWISKGSPLSPITVVCSD